MQSERLRWLSWMSSGAVGSLLLLPFWVPWSSAPVLGLSFLSVLLFTALSISLLGSFCGLLLWVVLRLAQTPVGRLGVILFVSVPLFVSHWMLTRGAWIQQQWWRWPALGALLVIELSCLWLLLRLVSRKSPSVSPVLDTGAQAPTPIDSRLDTSASRRRDTGMTGEVVQHTGTAQTRMDSPVKDRAGLAPWNDGRGSAAFRKPNALGLPGYLLPGIVLASILCMLADRYILPGLYLPFHIGAIAAAVFFAAIAGVSRWKDSPLVRWASPIVIILLLPVSFWLAQTPAAWGAVSKSAGVAKAFSAVAVAIGVGPKLPPATQSTVKQLEWPAGVARPSLQNADVILITIDALRADRLGIYGSQKNLTPNLDALAKKSVVFSRAYAPSPTSSYSLASLFCSRNAFGQMREAPAKWMTLAEHLAANGYRTSAIYNEGIFFTDKEKFSWFNESGFGFQKKRIEYMDSYEISRAALANLNEAAGPAFVWLHIAEPHEPYQVRPGFERGPTPEDRYDAEVWYADKHLEQLLAPIAGRNAIVIVASDHGEAFGEHSAYYHTSDVYSEQARIPLFIFFPGVEPRVIDAPQGLVDLAPTLLDLLNLSPLPEAQGRSLAPLLVGQTPDDAPIFSEWKHRRAIALGEHRLLCDTMTNACELYDISSDVEELHDLSIKDPETTTFLAAKLNAFLSNQESYRDSFVWPESIERLARGDRSQLTQALGYLQDPNPKIRGRVAQLLGTLGVQESRDALNKTTQDKEREVRLQASLSLAALGDVRAITPLRALLAQEQGQRAAIIVALGLVGGATADELAEAIQEKDPELSKKAIALLVAKKELTQRAEEQLSKSLAMGPLIEVSAAALGALQAQRSVPALMEALQKTTQIPERAAIAKALGQLQDPSALAALIERAAFGEGGDHLGEAIAQLGAAPTPMSAGGLIQSVISNPKHWRCSPPSSSGKPSEARPGDPSGKDGVCELIQPQGELTITLPDELSARPYILFLSASGEGELIISSRDFEHKTLLPASLTDLRVPLPASLTIPGETLKIRLRASSLSLSLAMILPVPDDISTRYK